MNRVSLCDFPAERFLRRSVIVLSALIVIAATGPAHAATFNVNSTADAVDANPTVANPACETAPGNGVCTLRAAIQQANALGGAHTINLPAGNYLLTRSGNDDNAINGDLDITGTLTLNGAGAGSTIIDGNSIDRVFHVLVGATVTMSGVTIRGGNLSGADGGGIWNESNLTLSGVTLSNNVARDGGAIFSQNTSNSVTLSNVVLSGNTASRDGGAIGMKDTGATLSFTDVTMTGNTAVARGGGYFGDRASGPMTRVTVSGNSAQDGGGLAMTNSLANVTLTDVTV
ncbi:MAG: CSLREA domain-containing protein, partial [Betaproteobacteria bacterium]|nr:CSLREA domain-containing protein [Betaproteobacteria bacterium]